MTASWTRCLASLSRLSGLSRSGLGLAGLGLAGLAGLAGCDDGGTAAATDTGVADTGVADAGQRPVINLADLPLPKLSDYGFFQGRLADERPAPGVVPYTVIAPLWADHAEKGRFIFLPEGTVMDTTDPDHWALPVGSIVIKSFSDSADLRDLEGTRRLIETRLLIHEDDGWTGHTYLWDAEQTEATRFVPGRHLTRDFIDAAGQPQSKPYIVPNNNQCKNCHELDDSVRVLGLATRQMSLKQQEDLRAAGVLAELPAPIPLLEDPFGDGPLERRARSYLDANCSHCHRPGGGGGTSGLVLLAEETRPSAYGICKSPVAAGPGAGGRIHDITPGDPDASIMIYRMSSTDPEIKMPEIPNLLVDDAGVELIRTWIAALDPPGCN